MNLKKKILLCCIFGTFLFPINCFAMTYEIKDYFCYHNDNRRSVTQNNWLRTGTCRNGDEKRYYSLKTTEGTDLYCTELNIDAETEQTGIYSRPTGNYFVDEGWPNKRCKYTVNGTVHEDGKCSKIIGFIIAEARSQGDTEVEKYWYVQNSIWAYFGDINAGVVNDGRDLYYKNNKISWNDNRPDYNFFREIINSAVVKYHNSRRTAENPNIDFYLQINNNDTSLYYNPTGSCGGAERYTSKTITVKNTYSETLQFSFGYTNGVQFSDELSHGFTLASGQSKQFTITYARFDASEVELSVTARKETNNIIETHDTVRYYSATPGMGDVYQKMITVSDGSYEVEKTKRLVFRKKQVTHKTCNDFPNNKTDNENTYTPSSGVVSKSCASKFIDSSGNLPTKDKYEANFANCDCKLIEFDGGKVNIRIYENVLFRYGVLNPISVYPGGGFRFARKNESITTDYISSLTWRYVDYKDNKPYYYNISNMSDSIVNADIHKKIDEKVKSLIKDSLDLKFETIDSNDAKVGEKTITISSGLTVTETKNNIDGYNYTTYLSKTSDNGISMNDAYFGNDGTVSYDSNSGYLHFGGKNYYIPVNYRDSSFPFKIPEINLSVIKDNFYKFLYEADCSIKVINDPDKPNPGPDPSDNPEPSDEPDYFEKAIVYRSIDLNNPFPRANQSTGEGIKENWKDWYAGSNSNKQRLKRAFDNYPSAPLYAVEMDSDKLKRIFDKGRSYNDWNSISDGGVNSFIMEYGVDYSRSGNSFCYIGQFNSECDRW